MQLKNIPGYLKLFLGIQANEQLGFRVVTTLARYFIPGYKFTWSELSWFDNPGLSKLLARFDERDGFNAHRRLALQQLLRLTTAVAGDTAECGVYKGCSSYLVLQANQQSPESRIHHIFDSFEGLSAPIGVDGAYWTQNDLAIGEATVRNNLAEFTHVKYYKGWIPTRFVEVADRRFSFVHVDVDLYQPTLDSIEFFYPRLTAGAIFVCDDFGFISCPGATAAIDEFLLAKPEKMVALAGGGGFFIKGCVTALEQ